MKKICCTIMIFLSGLNGMIFQEKADRARSERKLSISGYLSAPILLPDDTVSLSHIIRYPSVQPADGIKRFKGEEARRILYERGMSIDIPIDAQELSIFYYAFFQRVPVYIVHYIAQNQHFIRVVGNEIITQEISDTIQTWNTEQKEEQSEPYLNSIRRSTKVLKVIIKKALLHTEKQFLKVEIDAKTPGILESWRIAHPYKVVIPVRNTSAEVYIFRKEGIGTSQRDREKGILQHSIYQFCILVSIQDRSAQARDDEKKIAESIVERINSILESQQIRVPHAKIQQQQTGKVPHWNVLYSTKRLTDHTRQVWNAMDQAVMGTAQEYLSASHSHPLQEQVTVKNEPSDPEKEYREYLRFISLLIPQQFQIMYQQSTDTYWYHVYKQGEATPAAYTTYAQVYPHIEAQAQSAALERLIRLADQLGSTSMFEDLCTLISHADRPPTIAVYDREKRQYSYYDAKDYVMALWHISDQAQAINRRYPETSLFGGSFDSIEGPFQFSQEGLLEGIYPAFIEGLEEETIVASSNALSSQLCQLQYVTQRQGVRYIKRTGLVVIDVHWGTRQEPDCKMWNILTDQSQPEFMQSIEALETKVRVYQARKNTYVEQQRQALASLWQTLQVWTEYQQLAKVRQERGNVSLAVATLNQSLVAICKKAQENHVLNDFDITCNTTRLVYYPQERKAVRFGDPEGRYFILREELTKIQQEAKKEGESVEELLRDGYGLPPEWNPFRELRAVLLPPGFYFEGPAKQQTVSGHFYPGGKEQILSLRVIPRIQFDMTIAIEPAELEDMRQQSSSIVIILPSNTYSREIEALLGWNEPCSISTAIAAALANMATHQGEMSKSA